MNKNNIFASLSLLFCFAVTAVLFQNSTLSRAQAAILAVTSNCNCNSCSHSHRRIKRRCPKCQNDFCTLKCEKNKVTKKCFNVDQKIVCIPKVTWPWQKCPAKCARTRTVNVLKSDKYECCECKYTWSVYEPPLPKTMKQIQDEQELQMERIRSLQQEAEKPAFESNELYDPSGGDVPQPPQPGSSSK